MDLRRTGWTKWGPGDVRGYDCGYKGPLVMVGDPVVAIWCPVVAEGGVRLWWGPQFGLGGPEM